VVIGQASFGKGLVQKQYNLSDGSALVLTVEKYFTPSGRTIQKPYDLEINNSAFHVDTLNPNFVTDLGRSLESNGGVLPDYEIEVNMNLTSACNQELIQFMAPFIFLSYPKSPFLSWDEFLVNNIVSEADLDNFVQFAKVDGTSLSPDCNKILKTNLRFRLAHYWYGKSAMFDLFIREDIAIEKAIEILRVKDPIAELLAN